MISAYIDAEATGERIWELRKENKLTVEKLSELVGTSDPRALYKWRRGVTLPSLDNLIALAEIFRTPVDDIIVRRKTKER